MPNSLDIVLPCYRPPQGWVDRILLTMTALSDRLAPLSLKLILVNDGSPTGVEPGDTGRLAAGLPGFEYLPLAVNGGKGAALRAGVARSKADFCVFTDIDFPYEVDSIVEVVQTLLAGQDIAIGIKDQTYYEQTPRMRRRVSRFLRWLARTFLRISITDTQCGLKGFNAKGRDIFLQTTISRYLADLEFIFLADRSPLAMQAVEVHLREGVQFSKVNIRILLTEGGNFFRVWLRSLF